MDLRDILSSPAEKETPRTNLSTPGTPVQSPFKFVQRTHSGPLQSGHLKHGLGASPLSQTVMNQANVPAHILSPAQQSVSSPLISPVPASTVVQASRASSTPTMDGLSDVSSFPNHQSARPTQALFRSKNSYESQHSPSYSSALAQSLTSNPRASFDINMMDTQKESVRTDFSGTSLSPEKQERLSEVVTYLQENPSAYESHVEIIKILHDGFIDYIYPSSEPDARRDPREYDLLQDLRNAREQMEKLFAVGETLWSDWIQDESMLAQTAEERIAVVEKCRKALEEEMGSTNLWTTYGDWVHHCYDWAHDSQAETTPDEEKLVGRELFTWELVSDTWQEAVDQTSFDLANSHRTWNKYLRIHIPHEKMTQSQVESGIVLYQERLRKPHVTWDDTFQAFSSFVSTHVEDQYEQIMSQTNRASAGAKQKMAAREPFELAIEQAQNANDRDAEYVAFTRYIQFEQAPEKKKKPSFDLINALFQRAELRFPSDATLWEEHVIYLLGQAKPAVLMLLERATKHCPWSGKLWSQYLLTSDRLGRSFQDTENIKHKATNTGLLEAAGMEEVIEVHAAWCSYLRRRSARPDGNDEDMDVAEMGIRSSIENVSSLAAKLGMGDVADPSFRLHRIYITFLTEGGRWDNARHEFDTLVGDYGKSYEFWLRFYQWEMMRWRRFASNQDTEAEAASNIAPPHLATAVLKKALDQSSLDYPEPIIQTFVAHCEDHEDADELQQALLRVHKMQKVVTARRQIESAQYNALQEASLPTSDATNQPSSKRKREGDVNEDESNKRLRSEEAPQASVESSVEQPKRDREHATILVQNLPEHVTDTGIRQFFSNCGIVKSIKVLREDDVTAIVEFDDGDAAQYALSRDGRDFEGAILSVTLDIGSTLYVTNYKPTADEIFIRSLLEKYGEIVSVRFPSLQGNKKRRFCYVQFKLPAEAQAATKLDGQIFDELPIVCKISNPDIKKSRDEKTNVNDGHTIFIGQLNFKLSEKELEKSFAQYGKIDMIRMPRNELQKTRNKGIAFITYSDTEAANKALAMNGQELKDRKIVVKIAVNENRRGSTTRRTMSPGPITNGRAISPARSTPSVHQQKSDLQDRQIFLTNIPDTVNEERIRAMGEKYGAVIRVVLKTNHQGAVLEYATTAAAGEAALKLDGQEIDPSRPIRVVTEDEMKGVGREKKDDTLNGAKPKVISGPTPVGVVTGIKRPTQPGARKGGKLGQRAAPIFQTNANDAKVSDNQQINGAAKKNNEDFKAMFNKQ